MCQTRLFSLGEGQFWIYDHREGNKKQVSFLRTFMAMHSLDIEIRETMAGHDHLHPEGT